VPSLSVLATVVAPALGALPSAASPSPSPSSNGPADDLVTPGLLGFVALVFLLVAVVLIGRGLSKQLKRIDFDEETAGGGELAPARLRDAPSPASASVDRVGVDEAPGAGSGEVRPGDTESTGTDAPQRPSD
jgi:hypothetical protein